MSKWEGSMTGLCQMGELWVSCGGWPSFSALFLNLTSVPRVVQTYTQIQYIPYFRRNFLVISLVVFSTGHRSKWSSFWGYCSFGEDCRASEYQNGVLEKKLLEILLKILTESHILLRPRFSFHRDILHNISFLHKTLHMSGTSSIVICVNHRQLHVLGIWALASRRT